MSHARGPRMPSEAPSESSSSSSPDHVPDDDTDFFMAQPNDSQSSLGVGTFRDMSVSQDDDDRPQEPQPPVYSLPPELLIAVFTKLTAPKDLLNCMLVSHKWASHAVGALWHRPLCNSWANFETVVKSIGKEEEQDQKFFHYFDLVKRLNLSGLSDKVNDGSVHCFVSCKRIERLTLTNCAKLTDSSVSELLLGSRHLQALDVSELTSLTDHTMMAIADNCPRLQGLNITNCNKVTDESLVAISEKCKQIKRLKLNGVHQVTDQSIGSFANNCPSMLEIDLHGCNLITSGAVTRLLTHLRSLRELRLSQCTEITDQAFMDLPPRISLESLRVIDLTACEQVRDESVRRIVYAAPRLRNLILSKCRNITDAAVQAICRLGKNLHYIHLGHCGNLTDTAVMALIKACNRIRYIDLACCNHLTDQSVSHLACLPKLRRIGLVKCQAITDRSIQALAHPKVFMREALHPNDPGAAHQSSLERVHLSYCINLTLEGIHTLLNSCPRLTHLSLTGVQAFLRDELTNFCREAPQEFTAQQRDVFCVFSGEGVRKLRDFLNTEKRLAEEREEEGDDTEDGTMYNSAEGEEDFEHLPPLPAEGMPLPPLPTSQHPHANEPSAQEVSVLISSSLHVSQHEDDGQPGPAAAATAAHAANITDADGDAPMMIITDAGSAPLYSNPVETIEGFLEDGSPASG